MGFNTTIVLMNDTLDVIREDKDIGERIFKSVATYSRMDRSVDIQAIKGSIMCANAMTIISQDHADVKRLIAVGGNHGHTLPGSGHWKDDDETLLRKIADEMGFRLIRKKKP